MLNFDDELKNFKPSLEVSKIEEAIVRSDITDVQDIIIDMIKNVGNTRE